MGASRRRRTSLGSDISGFGAPQIYFGMIIIIIINNNSKHSHSGCKYVPGTLLNTLHTYSLIYSSAQPYEALIIISVLQNEKLRHREVKYNALVTQLVPPRDTCRLSGFRVWVLDHLNTMYLHETE